MSSSGAPRREARERGAPGAIVAAPIARGARAVRRPVRARLTPDPGGGAPGASAGRRRRPSTPERAHAAISWPRAISAISTPWRFTAQRTPSRRAPRAPKLGAGPARSHPDGLAASPTRARRDERPARPPEAPALEGSVDEIASSRAWRAPAAPRDVRSAAERVETRALDRLTARPPSGEPLPAKAVPLVVGGSRAFVFDSRLRSATRQRREPRRARSRRSRGSAACALVVATTRSARSTPVAPATIVRTRPVAGTSTTPAASLRQLGGAKPARS